jgi:hypothetical protein
MGLILDTLELNLERQVDMFPETVPHDADPISQISFPRTPSHLHQHAKSHVLGLDELPSLDEAKKVRWRISERILRWGPVLVADHLLQ